MGYLLAIFGAVLFTVASMKAPAMGVVMVALCVLLGFAVYPVFPMFHMVWFPGRNAARWGKNHGASLRSDELAALRLLVGHRPVVYGWHFNPISHWYNILCRRHF